jgi:thiosulfate/3-mercaptopyruvate sulfurtransferase
MLLYLGASEVYLLDGGWSSWLAREGEVQVGIESPERGHFTVRFHPERRRTLRTLRARFRTGTLPVLIDARTRAEFDGEIQECLPRGGHLVGACLVPFADLFEPAGRYVAREWYLKMLPQEARQASNLVAYCEVGVRAALLAMLHEAYTGQVVAVYDGSVMEWALAPDLPMSNTLSEPSQL